MVIGYCDHHIEHYGFGHKVRTFDEALVFQLADQGLTQGRGAIYGLGKLVLWATPLFLALIMVELVDLVFAVDSVPAIFAITSDPFIVYTSNIMAILGLRALYFALAAMVHRFHYLKYALALVLIFIGSKIFVSDFLMAGEKFPPVLSLGVTFGLILGGIGYSLWKTRGEEQPPISA